MPKPLPRPTLNGGDIVAYFGKLYTLNGKPTYDGWVRLWPVDEAEKWDTQGFHHVKLMVKI